MSSNPFVAILDPSTGNVGTVSATGEMSVKFLSTPAVTTTPTTSSTPTLTSVTSSATLVQLLASNVNRKGAIIHNDSGHTLLLVLGSVGSLTSYTDQVLSNNTWSMGELGVLFTGVISGIWNGADAKAAKITELT